MRPTWPWTKGRTPGPTAGAEEPGLPGTADEPAAADTHADDREGP